MGNTLDITYQANYHRSFEDRFLMETIIVHKAVDSNEETQDVIDWAREEAELNHKRNNPHLFPPDIPIIPKKEMQPDIILEEAETKMIYGKTLAEQIASCNSLNILESYKFIVKGKPELETIYQSKLKELQ